MVQLLASALVAALACAGTAAAEDFKLDSPDAIRKSAGVLAKDLMAFYDTKAKDFVPGLIPDDDYYWFQTGAFMTTMINYWQLTGDKTYNDVLLEGMLHQRGEQNDFLVANQTASTGNEDQCTWAQAAMLAAEYGFPSPPEGNPSWAQIAENVFNDQTTRIDNQTCTPGGLRWQIFQFNNGYDLQDAMSNTCYFNLGARLARFTGNSTYADAAVRSWDWMVKSGLLNTKDWDMWSSLSVDNEDECDNIDKVRSSLSSSLLAHGVASLLEQTNDGKWQERLDGILDNIMKHFFKDGVAWEEICEEDRECNVDQIVYRNTMFRSLGAISLLAPATADKMAPIMEKSAEAAVEQCTGGSSGRQCGFFWVDGEFEKPQTSGLGEQMNALSAVTNLLLKDAEKPQKEEKDNKGDNKEENKGEKGDGDESTKTEGGESEETPAPDSAAGRAAVGSVSVAVATVGMLLAALMA